MKRFLFFSFRGLVKSLLFLLVLFVDFHPLGAQQVSVVQNRVGSPVSASKEAETILRQHFLGYELHRFTGIPLGNPEAQLLLGLRMQGHAPLEMILERNELRSENCQTTEMGDNGMISHVAAPSGTYKGVVQGEPESQVRLSIYAGQISGFIQTASELRFIEPLKNLIPGAPTDVFISYRNIDVRETGESFCLSEQVEDRGIDIQQRLREGQGEENFRQPEPDTDQPLPSALFAAGDVVSNCTFLELATEADYEWFTDFGSTVASANAQILGILNQVEALYCSNFNMSFRVVYQNVHSIPADPYTSTTLLARLGEFRNLWNTTAPFNTVNRDLAHMFTGTNFGGGPVGYAWVGVVCSSGLGYGITQNYSSGLFGQLVILAHEMGHNFSSPHSTSVSCGALGSVMCPYVQSNSFYFSAATVAQINSHIATRNCLDPPGLNIVPAAASLCVSPSVTFTVPFDPAWSYQWYMDSVAIGGANANSYSASVPGTYIVDISNYDTTCTSCSVSLVATLSASNLVVTNTNDTGPGSLRDAIVNANSCPGWDTIVFDIPGAGPYVISPLSPLPAATDTVFINGYSQAGAALATSSVPANLQIVVEGSSAGTAAGLEISAPFSKVAGLCIHSFQGGTGTGGVGIYVNATNVLLVGNYLGTDVLGATSLSNLRAGIIGSGGANDLQIGTSNPNDLNLISGNGLWGIRLDGVGGRLLGVEIQGNRIGTDINGLLAIPNEIGIGMSSVDSVRIGGRNPGEGNQISGNDIHGIEFERFAQNNLVEGNLIGTDRNGVYAIGNGGAPSSFPTGSGIHIQGNRNLIGGDLPTARNVISGNSIGILIEPSYGQQQFASPVTGAVIQGNFIGVDTSGLSPLGNQGTGILFIHSEGSSSTVSGGGPKSNLVGGTSPGEENTIAYNGQATLSIQPYHLAGIAFRTNGVGARGDTKIYRNRIYQNEGLGIYIAPGALAGPPEYKAPILTSALVDCATQTTTISGDLVGNDPGTNYRIELFYNFIPDPSGFGEGETFLGTTNVLTDAAGAAAFSMPFPAIDIPTGTCISATATALDTGNTSEFSNNVCLTLVPLAIAPIADQTVCEGQGLSLVDFDPSIDVTYTIPGLGTVSSDTLFYTPTSGTDSIFVLRVDTCGRVALDTVAVTINPLPNLDLGPDTIICPDDTLVLDGGPGPGTFVWQDLSSNQIFPASSTGLYTVQLTDGSNCRSRDSIQILVDGPVVNLGPDTILCGGGILDAGLLEGGSYNWNTGESNQFILVDSAGTYAVEVTDSNGCQTVDTVLVDLDTVFVDLGPDTLHVSGDSLDAGNGGCSYSWSTGEATQVIFPPAPGTYQVTVTCPSGCGYVDEIVLDPQPLASGLVVLTANPTSSGSHVLEWNVDHGLAGSSLRLERAGLQTSFVPLWTGGTAGGTDRFENVNPEKGMNRYRLQVLTQSGERLYSNPVVLWFNQDLSLIVFPNPASDQLQLRWGADLNGQELKVLDGIGRMVRSCHLDSTGSLELDCGSWPRGVYLLNPGARSGKTVKLLLK